MTIFCLLLVFLKTAQAHCLFTLQWYLDSLPGLSSEVCSHPGVTGCQPGDLGTSVTDSEKAQANDTLS